MLDPDPGFGRLAGELGCDAVVVGGGFTGLAVARRVAELLPAGRIVVLESSLVGEGNPGRNSGFLLEVSLANDADAGALERMNACNRLIGSAMQEIVQLTDRCQIDCGLQRSGTYRAAAGGAGSAELNRYRCFLDAAGLPYEMLDRDELRSRLGTTFYREGLYSPHCYLVQPAALIRGMARHLPGSVRLFDRSPAVAIERHASRWRVRTPGGSIEAPLAFVANNAFCRGLDTGRSRIAAIYTCAALTEPLADEVLRSLGSERAWGLLPAHRLGSTFRRVQDGRLLVRSLYSYEKEMDAGGVARRLRRSMLRRFPALPDVPFASVWSGATGFTWNGAPLWGESEPGLFVSAGCNGGGVVKGTLFGRALADLAFGHSVPDIPARFGTPSWLPPDPLRRIGFAIVSAFERHRGRAEM